MSVRGPRAFLLGAAGCAAAFGFLLALIYLSSRARVADANALTGFIGLERPRVAAELEWLSHLGDPEAVGLMGLALACLALARGKPRHAAAVILLLALTSVSSQVLKAVIDYPRWESLYVFPIVRDAAFPSGHATAAMTIALCGVLVAPPRARPLAAAAGLVFALAISYSLLAIGSHFPSDVAAGFLVATGWTLVVVAALRAAATRWPERTGRSRARVKIAGAVERVTEAGLVVGLVTVAATGALAGAAFLLARSDQVAAYVTEHTTAVATALALAVAAISLLAAITAALRAGR
jgi:membrane-associated phospholipid phosphatase